MELKKYETIIVSGYRLDKRRLHYSVYTDSVSRNYYIDIPKQFDPAIFFTFYKLVLAIEGLSYAIIANRVIVDVPLDSAQTDFINRIKPPFYSDLCVLVGAILMSPAHLGEVTFYHKDEKAFNGSFTDYNKVAMCYSGGKESVLGYELLKECGYELLPMFVNAAVLDNTKSPFLPKGCVNIDTSNADSIYQLSSIIPQGVWNIPVYLLTKLILATILALSEGCGYVCIGSEFATTSITFDGIGGSVNYGHSWGQSNFAFGEFKRLLYSYDTRLEYFSPVQNFEPTHEELFLHMMYPQAFNRQHSCEYYYQNPQGYLEPCQTCIKCEILNAILTGLDKAYSLKLNSKFMFDKDVTTVGRNPVHYIFPYLSEDETSEIETLLQGEQVATASTLLWDILHTKEHLPKKFYNFLLTKHKQFETKLWKHVTLSRPSLRRNRSKK
jgi:hypothetical protein